MEYWQDDEKEIRLFVWASTYEKSWSNKSYSAKPIPLQSFVLHDIYDNCCCWGGKAIWVNCDRTATIQLTDLSPIQKDKMWEKRYNITLSDEQWSWAEQLVAGINFLDQRKEEREVAPHQPRRPTILVTTKRGMTVKASKDLYDPHPAFDPLYKYLLSLCRVRDDRIPDFEGHFDWKWRPDWFKFPL